MAPEKPEPEGRIGNQNRDPLPRLGLILLFLITLGWGTAWPAMKIVLNEMSPWTFRALTVPVSAVLLMGLCRLSRISLSVPHGKWKALIVVSLINVGGWQLFSALGLNELSSGRAVLVAYTMPVFASLSGALILGETLTNRIIGALLLGTVGVGALIWGNFGTLGASPLGVIYMLAAAFTWGLGIALLKKVDWRMPTLALASWQLLIAGVPIVAAGWLLDEIAFAPLSVLAANMLVYVVLVPICFCTYAFFKIVSLFPANVSAIGTLMIPVLGVISGSLVLDEPIGLREGTALVLIGASLALVLFRPAAPRENTQ
ncbi:MAG: DMT family transporter [Rhodospirillales bacterium]|nr:DMT family transporter [Rhodospirillales bacterium]